MEDNREVLIRESEQLNLLVKTLLASAKLNYRKSGLDFDDEIIDALLHGIAPVAYVVRLEALKNEE